MARQIVVDTQDLTHLTWARARQSSGTAGSFLKSYDDAGAVKTYYKLSDYDPAQGIVGHECVNEIVADRLLALLGIAHVPYRLVHARVLVDGRTHTTWLNASDDFKQPGEGKIALDTFYELEREGAETPLEFCVRRGWATEVYRMLVFDYVVLNRDRHGANIEVLRNARARTMRLAPLFDHGLSLMFRCRTPEEFAAFDPLADMPVQQFVGGRSARENLQLVPLDVLRALPALRQADRFALFEGLDEVMPDAWLDAAWNMVWERWCQVERLRD